MSDGTDKAKPRFEPPPWEVEQFERLRERREADERERAAEDARRRGAAEEAEEALRLQAGTAAAAVPTATAGQPGDAGEEPDGKSAGLDDRVVNAMLLQLQATAPHALAPVRDASMKVALALAIVAAIMLVFAGVSLVLFMRDKVAIWGFGAAMLAMLTLFCGGTAGWLFALSRK